MRHLHGDRRAVDQHDLVAPVELISLARREAQGHKGFRRHRAALGAPSLCIAPDRIIAALVAEPAQLLEDPNQRQPLTRRFVLLRQQQPIKLIAPWINPRQWLPAALVAKLGRLRPDHLAHDLPRHPKLAADRLDRLLLNEKRATDLCDRPWGCPGSRWPARWLWPDPSPPACSGTRSHDIGGAPFCQLR